MQAPENILAVWRRFDGFPMETLTKAWFYPRAGENKQRSVEMMKEHRQRYGNTGNCFDLALWLLDEFRKEGVRAYGVGSDLGTMEAHAAVVAEDAQGWRYLCDIGDQWLQPILVDGSAPAFRSGKLAGFFPAAEVEIFPAGRSVDIVYHRPGGKASEQTYELEPVDDEAFRQAAEFSQRHIYPKALLEVRIPYKAETAHWEFEHWESFLSTSEGLFRDAPVSTLDEWVERIHEKTGFDRQFLKEALEIYKKGIKQDNKMETE